MLIKITGKKEKQIERNRIGIFFEDINYALDGGLNAEMLENGNFEALDCYGDKADYYVVHDGGYAWRMVDGEAQSRMSVVTGSMADGEEKSKMLVVTGSPVAEENPHYLRVMSTIKGCGFSNKAYDGIYLQKGGIYQVSLYVRCVEYAGAVQISVEKEGKTFASSAFYPTPGIRGAEKSWKKYELSLEAQEEVVHGEFVIRLAEAGIVEFDFISMKPSDAVAGIFRKDIFSMLEQLKPGFVRFPGGCIVEGNTLANRYRYKDTLKPLENRRNNWNRWAVHENSRENGYHGSFSHYNQSLAIGYYEYFLLSELLGARPLPVLNVGMACQFQSYEKAEIGSSEFEEYIQDALDLIEFANGSTKTHWGAVRAGMGHVLPFHLEFLGVGNEQWETKDAAYFQRYSRFERAIHEKYPEIKLIGSAGPDVTSEKYHMAWEFYRAGKKAREGFVYAVDEHYYMPPEWFVEHTDFYDDYPGEIKVFAGEYAAHPKDIQRLDERNTLGAALAEAAFLLGVEKNGDKVPLLSYAPLLARDGYAQWGPNLIWFDDKAVYGTPSYHIQRMLSELAGDTVLEAKAEQALDDVFFDAVEDHAAGKVFLRVVNLREESVTVRVEAEPEGALRMTECWCAGGSDKRTVNTFEKPETVALRTEQLDGCKEIVVPQNAVVTVVLLPLERSLTCVEE